MPKYRLHVRMNYFKNATIEVEADSEEQARAILEEKWEDALDQFVQTSSERSYKLQVQKEADKQFYAD